MGDGGSSSIGGGRRGGDSVVIDYGRRRTSCGYCKSSSPSSISHGLSANSLTAHDYQDLLDRGWRRSGCFLYKPEMETTCCPAYTIRLKASDFVPSKDQARVLKKMQRFLDGELDPENQKHKSNSTKQSIESCSTKHSTVSENAIPSGSSQNVSKEGQLISDLSNKIDCAIDTCFRNGVLNSDVQLPKAAVKNVKPQIKKKLTDSSSDLLYTSNVSFQIAAAIERSLPKEKNTVRLNDREELLHISPKSIAEHLVRIMDYHGEIPSLVLKACNGHLNFYSAANPTAANHISIDSPAEASKGDGGDSKRSAVATIDKNLPKRRKLEIRMKRSKFDPEEFALYHKYQTRVHNEDVVTESSYQRFLVDTPIVFVPPKKGDDTIPPCGFGSFHQQYLIDGKLIAVGVVDILPRCLSSKYLFWDPDLALLSLGKYTALQEINWVKTTQIHCPSLQYYYLGYYIHSCRKMRYKAAYQPSELLCPARYEWVLYDIARPLLDKSSYVVLSEYARLQDQSLPPQNSCISVNSSRKHDHDEYLIDEDEDIDFEYEDSDMGIDDNDELAPFEINDDMSKDVSSKTDIENVMVDVNGSRVKFKELQQVFGAIEKKYIVGLERQLDRYIKVVGNELSSRLAYSLD